MSVCVCVYICIKKTSNDGNNSGTRSSGNGRDPPAAN